MVKHPYAEDKEDRDSPMKPYGRFWRGGGFDVEVGRAWRRLFQRKGRKGSDAKDAKIFKHGLLGLTRMRDSLTKRRKRFRLTAS